MNHRIGMIVNNRKQIALDASRYLKSEFAKRGISVWTDGDQSVPPFLELLIILGGDGTVLQAFSKYCHLQVPFLCINFGSVGFLSSIDFDEFSLYLPSIIAKKYQVDERPIMQVSVDRYNQDIKHYYALNDLVIKSDHLHISRQFLRIDGQDICSYEGDGLIIATPTGSTGYALSAGASIVEPVLGVFVITPLFPRKKSLNSLIVGMNHKLEIVCQDPESLSKPFIDGKELTPLNNGDLIYVRSTDLKAKFVVLNPDRYFNLLRRRCM